MVILDRLEPGIKSAVANTELSAREQHTLGLLYETLIARHEPGPGDDRRVMQTSAGDVSLLPPVTIRHYGTFAGRSKELPPRSARPGMPGNPRRPGRQIVAQAAQGVVSPVFGRLPLGGRLRP